MGILDELRAESASLRSADEREEARLRQLEATYRSDILPRLQHAFGYLNEMVNHLNYINHDIQIDVYENDIRGIGPLNQAKYRVSTDEHGGVSDLNDLQELKLQYTCSGGGEIVYDIIGTRNIELEETRIRNMGLKYQLLRHTNSTGNERSATFTIEKHIPVIFRFRADIENSRIKLFIKNHEGIREQSYNLSPQMLNDDFLEQMGRYILRRENGFLRDGIPADKKKELQELVQQEKEQREREQSLAADAEPSAGSDTGKPIVNKFKSLLNKRQ